MISRDIAIVDWQPEHWLHLVQGPRRHGGQGGGWLVLVCDEQDRIVHAVLRGKPCTELAGQVVGDLRERRRAMGAARAACLEQGFLRRTMSRAERRLQFRMDYVEQLLTLIAAFRDERGSGLRLDPPSPPGPIPPFAWVQFLFDRLWPDDTAVVLYVVDEARSELWTSLILRKSGGHLDLLTSDLHLGDEGLKAERWRSDRKRLLEVVGARVATPFFGCFTTLSAWRDWRAAALGSAVLPGLRASGDVALEPLPRRFRLLLMALRALGLALRR